MSEFTKYELESLLWAISYVRERTNNCGDVMRALREKIESMINGYKRCAGKILDDDNNHHDL